MKNSLWFLCVISSSLLIAQSLRIVTNIAVSEAEYRNAEEMWRKNDPDLISDLYKGNKQEVVRRIHHAATLAEDMLSKKATYLASLIQHTDEMEKRLSSAQGTQTIPFADLKDDLEREQARILDEQDRLDDRLHDLPQGDELTLVRHAMESERAELVVVQNDIAQRIHAMDNAAKTQQASSALSDVDPLIRKLEDIKKMWEGERARAVAQKPAYGKMYSDMEKSLDNQSGSGSNPSTRPSGNPSIPLAPSPGRNPGAMLLKSPANGSLSGDWVYKSEQGGWVGLGEPEMVLLQLRQVGLRLNGIYSARLPGTHDTRSLNLVVEGQIEGDGRAELRWTSLEPPAHGMLTIKAGPNDRLLVERLTSEDNYIPQGMEVLQR
jgi:hypothetical protein